MEAYAAIVLLAILGAINVFLVFVHPVFVFPGMLIAVALAFFSAMVGLKASNSLSKENQND